jgi:hypothetical protein
MVTTQEEPRAGSETVGGVRWLARMIDKAQLGAEGKLEALDLEYPCPMDQGLLKQLGIDGTTFQSVVVASENDEQVLAKLQAHGVTLPV